MPCNNRHLKNITLEKICNGLELQSLYEWRHCLKLIFFDKTVNEYLCLYLEFLKKFCEMD